MEKEQKVVISFLEKSLELLNGQMTMEEIFKHSIIANGNKRAFEYYNDNEKYSSLSYRQCYKKIKLFASRISYALKDIEKQKVVVFKLSNSPLWCELFWAILMAGYKPLLINAKTNKFGTINLINHSNAVAIITDDPFFYPVKKITIDDLLTGKKDNSFIPSWENEIVFCSSGTTGDVKLMVFNGENLCHQIASSKEMGKYTNDIMYPSKYGRIKILSMIPLHHIFGFVAVFLWYTFYGKTIVFPKSMNSKDIQEVCIKKHVTHVYSVPLFWDSLALQFERRKEMANEQQKALIEKYAKKLLLGEKVKFCISGGGYLSPKTSEIINNIGYPLHNGFGMTELGVTSVDLSNEIETRLKCSVGRPFYGIEYKLDVNNNDELLIKSKIIHCKEIIKNNFVESKFDNEGFFHTGDIASIDEDGNYFIKGRIKDVIISSNGENIFPDELELYFSDLEKVDSYCVVGIGSEKDKHVENVCLVLQVNNSFTYEDATKLQTKVAVISKRLPKGTKIYKIYFTRKPLPKANDIKVKRLFVKKEIESGSDNYFEFKEESKPIIKNIDPKIQKEIMEPLRAIFASVLLLPISSIQYDSRWINDLGGDSMNFFELVIRVNSQFNVVIPDELFGELSTIHDFTDAIIKIKAE